MLPKVGIIGLGDQGMPIAQNILKGGYPLYFYARREGPCREIEATGGQFLPPVELAQTCDILLLVVVDDVQVKQVLLEKGVLSAMRPGSKVVIHSTIAPDTCRELAEIGTRSGIKVMDAPVSGGRARSYAGELSIMVGGEREDFDTVRPLLATYGSSIFHMGSVGLAQTAKIINNYFYAAHLATAAKEVELIKKLGINIDAAAAVLPTCSGSSNAFAMQASTHFVRAQHDKGPAYAMSILSGVVHLARNIAADVSVDLSLIDPVVDKGIADEARRDAATTRKPIAGT